MKILTVIPARGGSKGVPRKNIRPLHGKPLIVYTIEAALNVFDPYQVIVSTDSVKIGLKAMTAGARVPFWRPAELAQDNTPMIDVIQHAVERMEIEQGKFDWILLLQPTCPLRTADDIRAAVSLAQRGNCDSVISVTRMEDYHPARMYKMSCDGFLTPLFWDEEKKRRQDLSTVYHRNGAIYLTRRDIIMAGELWATEAVPYVMPPERSVNIDSEIDFKLAEVVLCQ